MGGKIFSNILLYVLIFSFTENAFSFSWKDMWLKKDLQGAKAFSKGYVQEAAQLFESPLWKGVALYRASQYKSAADAFAEKDTPISNYNRGNALAKAGQYQAAIAAYDRALQQQAHFEDAKYNRSLVEQLLKQINQQNQQPSPQDQNKSSSSSKQSDPSSKQPTDKSSPEKSSTDSSQQQKQSQNNQNESLPKESPARDNAKASESQTSAQNQSSDPHQQAQQQWLQQVPDDPGGLLRQKFLRDHLRNKEKDL